MVQEFKAFLLRGNVLDLAVAVVIGAAFTAVITALVTGIITPFIAMLVGEPSFVGLTFEINNAVFFYGALLDAIVSFVLVAAALFFFVIKPANILIARSRKEPPADPTTKKCPECLSEIPLEARRCAFCTSEFAV
ncbi:MAG TPA: large conductance mechanosensitive channel protein MscL [Tepidiformaceae bacterium]|nr:large conductance mechanosensitive channel protein MscL [Tepidiformaceae bacterium]